MLDTATPARLAGVLDGFPRDLLPDRASDRLIRLVLDLDSLGRLEAGTSAPLVEPHTLRALLRELLPAAEADRLVDFLAGHPDAAVVRSVHPSSAEVPWFEVAGRVVIYDPEPDAPFRALGLAPGATAADVVAAVHARFPSMEPELLEPETLPPRILERLDDGEFERVLGEIVRQLGWWAALTAVLLVPAARLAAGRAEGGEGAPLPAAWPLWMHAAGAAFGGWTLTVVGSCILAPLD